MGKKKLSKKKLAALAKKEAEEARAAEITQLQRIKQEEEDRLIRLEEERQQAKQERREENRRLRTEYEEDDQVLADRFSAADTVLRRNKAMREWLEFRDAVPLPRGDDEAELNSFYTLQREALYGPDFQMPDTTYRENTYFDEDEEAERAFHAYKEVGPTGLVWIRARGLEEVEEEAGGQQQQAEYGAAGAGSGGDERTSTLLLKRVVDDCELSEQVLARVQSAAATASEQMDVETTSNASRYTRMFRELTQSKLDALTASILRCADDYRYILPDTMAEAEKRLREAMTEAGLQGGPAGGAGGGGTLRHGNNAEMAVDEASLKHEVLENYGTDDVAMGIWCHPYGKKHNRRKVVEFDNIGVSVGLPQSLSMDTEVIAMRAIQTSYDHVSVLSDSSYYVSVGGLLCVDRLEVPPEPTSVKGWIKREVTDLYDDVRVMDVGGATMAAAAAGAMAQFDVTYTVPSFVFINSKKPTLGWWDDKAQAWRTDGISDVSFDHAKHRLKFSTTRLKPFAVLRPRALDFPYRYWSLRALSSTSALLDVVTSRFDVRIEIVRDKCRLLAPACARLAHVNEQLLTPGELLRAMTRSGLCIQPTDEDAGFCRTELKHVALEARVHDEVTGLLPHFEVRASMWNAAAGPNTCYLQIRRLEDDSLASDDEEEVVEEEVDTQLDSGSDSEDSAGESNLGMRYPSDEREHDEGKDGASESDGDARSETGDVEERDAESTASVVRSDATDATGVAEVDGPQCAPSAVVDVPLDTADADAGWVTVMCDKARFVFVETSDTEAPKTPLPGQVSHATLLRALQSYYGEDDDAVRNQTLRFCDVDSASFQVTVRGLLNLVRVLCFH